MTPWWTIGICAAAGAVFGAPQLEALLVYNREAIAQGELWRVVTGNLVHLSAAHLLRDLIALLVTGALIERSCRGDFPLLCLVSAPCIGAVLYLAEPGLLVYGGLSGVVCAALAYLCLQGLSAKGAYRGLCIALLVGLAGKLALELCGAGPLLPADAQIAVVPTSHAAGAAAALLFFVAGARRRPA